MRPVEAQTLRLLADIPFLDRLEAVAVSGWSRGAVYAAVETLERMGLADSAPHASELIAPTRRYSLTADGLRMLAREEGTSLAETLRNRPVSNQWRRVLLERLDGLAVIYRLASALSSIAHPIRFRWFRAMPMDAAVALPDGRVIAVVRQGPATDRTGFSKRLWRLREGRPAAVLLLMPDEARLRHARRLLAGAPSIAYLALESKAASAGAGAPVWRTPSPGPPSSTLSPPWSTPGRAAPGPPRSRRRGHPSPQTSTQRPGRTGRWPPCSSPPRSAPSTCSPTGPG